MVRPLEQAFGKLRMERASLRLPVTNVFFFFFPLQRRFMCWPESSSVPNSSAHPLYVYCVYSPINARKPGRLPCFQFPDSVSVSAIKTLWDLTPIPARLRHRPPEPDQTTPSRAETPDVWPGGDVIRTSRAVSMSARISSVRRRLAESCLGVSNQPSESRCSPERL